MVPEIELRSRENVDMNLCVKPDDLSSPKIAELLAEHLHDMHEQSPPGSVHALDLNELRKADITFWSVWSDDELVGCGALKELDGEHSEIKSMRTARAFRGKGAGKLILQHIIDEARSRGYKRLSLETGSMEFFDPARRLYGSYGFEYCGPFGDYILDPNSVFMTMDLTEPTSDEVVDAWVKYWQTRNDHDRNAACGWAHEFLFDCLTMNNLPEKVWEFILKAYKRELDDRVVSILAAGPVEDLLAYYGAEYIDRVETLARQDPKFNYLLGGVWKNAMTEEVWDRLQAARRETW